MKGSIRRRGNTFGGDQAFSLLGMLITLLAVLLFPALAAAAGGGKAPGANPHLASLQIEIWPEYDRPGALVILRAEIAPNVVLPVPVSMRIPAASGGPSAVAYSSVATGNLFTLNHEQEAAGDSIRLKLEVPQRYFHVEFYDPIAMTAAGRSYTYAWPGDLATDRLAVLIQEPAGVLDLVATPAHEGIAPGQDGLRYRKTELGAFPAGKRLDVNVRYSKADARTSVEILKGRAPESPGSAAMPKPMAAESPPPPFTGPSKRAAIIWLAGLAVVMVLGGVAALGWRHWRKSAPTRRAHDASLCRKCKMAVIPGARFCSACGAPLA